MEEETAMKADREMSELEPVEYEINALNDKLVALKQLSRKVFSLIKQGSDTESSPSSKVEGREKGETRLKEMALKLGEDCGGLYSDIYNTLNNMCDMVR